MILWGKIQLINGAFALLTALFPVLGFAGSDCPELWAQLQERQSLSPRTRIVEGHGHSQIEDNLTYQPLREELQSTKNGKREFFATEIGPTGQKSVLFYRIFPNLNLITLDLEHVSLSRQGQGIGFQLLKEVTLKHPEIKNLHVVLDYANRRAFEEAVDLPISDRLGKVPSLRSIIKLGFSRLTYVGNINIPGDPNVYPELVLSKF